LLAAVCGEVAARDQQDRRGGEVGDGGKVVQQIVIGIERAAEHVRRELVDTDGVAVGARVPPAAPRWLSCLPQSQAERSTAGRLGVLYASAYIPDHLAYQSYTPNRSTV
jgi:hypothetical protein